MKDINSVALVGRLTRDAEIKREGLIAFSLAVNRTVRDGDNWKDEASFFDCQHWTKADIAKYLTKGKQIAIVGELIQDRWEKDGQARSRVIINVSQVQFIGSKDQVIIKETKDDFIDDVPF